MRKVMSILVIGLLGLFGFYYMKNTGDGTAEEKAKSAFGQVVDKVRDTGVASLVKTKLVANHGTEKTRFLHAFYDDGQILVYGLVPESLTGDQIFEIASKVKGVQGTQVIVSPLPDFAAAQGVLGAEKQTPPATEAPAGG